MTKFMEINGEQFEVIRSAKTQQMIDYHFVNYKGRDLSNYYEKPSEIKKSIWREWSKWAGACDEIHYFEVTSGNWNRFTISGIYYGINETGFIQITKEHNRLYICAGD